MHPRRCPAPRRYHPAEGLSPRTDVNRSTRSVRGPPWSRSRPATNALPTASPLQRGLLTIAAAAERGPRPFGRSRCGDRRPRSLRFHPAVPPSPSARAKPRPLVPSITRRTQVELPVHTCSGSLSRTAHHSAAFPVHRVAHKRRGFLLPRGCHMQGDQRGSRGDQPGQPVDVTCVVITGALVIFYALRSREAHGCTGQCS